jgi:hypothetical protein
MTPKSKMLKPCSSRALLVATGLCFLSSLLGCSDHASAPPPVPASVMGTPQQQLDMLEKSPMSPELKARKRQILEDEIHGTRTFRPGHNGGQ